MMKNILTMFCICFSLLVFSSCDMEPKSFGKELQGMEQAIFSRIPSTQRVTLEVKNDFGYELIVTLGDAELYNAPEETQQKAADTLAVIAAEIFGERLPKHGKLHIVENETNLDVDQATVKTVKLDLKELRN